MNARLGRRYRFSASHRLHVSALGDEQNREIYGKCNNPFGHGHNYIVEVSFSGPINTETGMVTNLADLDAFAHKHVLPLVDQMNLNSIALFAQQVPSTENLAIELHRLFSAYPDAMLHHVHVQETTNNSFTYFGPNGKAGSHAP